GKWLTHDPLGLKAGPNLYAYVLNNPLSRFDLYGLAHAEIERMNQLNGGEYHNDASGYTCSSRDHGNHNDNYAGHSSKSADGVSYESPSNSNVWDSIYEKGPGVGCNKLMFFEDNLVEFFPLIFVLFFQRQLEYTASPA